MCSSNISLLRRTTVVIGLAAVLGACSDGREAAQPAGPAKAVAARPASRMVKAETGLDRLPRPRDPDALHRSLQRHYPSRFVAEGRRGAVLLDLQIDPEGVVRAVDVVPPPAADAPGGAVSRAVLLDQDAKTGRTVERVVETRYDPAFGPAARAALLGARFSPAVRDGRAVAHTLRMTVEFAPPAGS
ncbi:MAG TPA: hypothetical protein VHG91_12695 [Longimicrobium sp.]|nr:hypothetical protein [Longimicrobium sp.]